jgi:choline dehydrogenase-like flavoprotein
LIENDVVVLPFLFRRGMNRSERRFTLSEAAIAIDPAGPLERPAHLQLYRPGGATLGPLSTILDRLPSPLQAMLMRGIMRLAVGMLYLHGTQSRGLRVRLLPGEAPIAPIKVIPETGGVGAMAARAAIRRLGAARRHLGLQPIALAQRRGGPGFSAHLGGTLPMRHRPDRLECHPDGRLAGSTEGAPVFVVDLSNFPEMPAQNPTLTGVANAMRIAAHYMAARH